MNRRHALLALITLPIAARALDLGSVAGALKDPLVSMLTSKLGVNDNQAQGGLGSMLTLAKEKLPATDFSKLTKLVPNASKYMELAKTLGAVAGPLKNMAGLNGALGKLGMTSQQQTSFVPTVTDYLGKAGGSTVQGLLGKVFK